MGMFRVQVFKEGLCKTALGAENQQRYFNTDELKNLFTKLEDESSSTLNMMQCEENPDEILDKITADMGELEHGSIFWEKGGLHCFANFTDLYNDKDQVALESDEAIDLAVKTAREQLC